MSLVDETGLLDVPEYMAHEPPFGPHYNSFMWPVPSSHRSFWANFRVPRQLYYRRWPVQLSSFFIWATFWATPPSSTLRRKQPQTPACWLPNQN